ncbi:TIGR01212 family radical SAM protein [Cellulosilyticum sp. I15G10I2]|uniref:TIGR01212 family radical SAM protein n=1 Tax=Cellulosilyticum sp. I15G10I2 TaxID=1892843 RepID=UPI00085C5981|nr:TIGR01212 family radical SAM protein [Cellulosilyticum sp. I15G10I2]
METYNKYAAYLKERYGGKVYKIPVHLPVTCPNRDGTCGIGGCSFCGEAGAGYEMRDAYEAVKVQLDANMQYIGQKYKAQFFIAYFQNFSNTYMPLKLFKEVLEEIQHEDIIGIAISTRPDCIHTQYLDVLKEWSLKTKKEVCIELGLQTVNYHSLKKVNRGHSLAEYLDAFFKIKSYHFEICTHLILNLPWDNMDDVIENAKCMTALKSDYVKLHALYLVKGTPMAEDYLSGKINLITREDYQQRVIHFLRYLSKDIIVQRIIGRAPKSYTLFSNWDTSWWKIHDEIVEEMIQKEYSQGDLCDYIEGKAVRKFL